MRHLVVRAQMLRELTLGNQNEVMSFPSNFLRQDAPLLCSVALHICDQTWPSALPVLRNLTLLHIDLTKHTRDLDYESLLRVMRQNSTLECLEPDGALTPPRTRLEIDFGIEIPYLNTLRLSGDSDFTCHRFIRAPELSRVNEIKVGTSLKTSARGCLLLVTLLTEILIKHELLLRALCLSIQSTGHKGDFIATNNRSEAYQIPWKRIHVASRFQSHTLEKDICCLQISITTTMTLHSASL